MTQALGRGIKMQLAHDKINVISSDHMKQLLFRNKDLKMVDAAEPEKLLQRIPSIKESIS